MRRKAKSEKGMGTHSTCKCFALDFPKSSPRVAESKNISKSKRRGLFESLVFKLIHVRPYRCQSCDLRFFRWAGPHVHSVSHIAATSTRSDFQGAMSPLSEGENAVDEALMGEKYLQESQESQVLQRRYPAGSF